MLAVSSRLCTTNYTHIQVDDGTHFELHFIFISIYLLHSGWFLQSRENNIQKDYNYQFSSLNDKFVEWNERTLRNGIQETFTGLIYVARPYLTAVDVTERRNLVYNFRSLLARDPKGHLSAGVYFKVKENCDEFTIFYQDMGKQRVKLNFSTLKLPIQVCIY